MLASARAHPLRALAPLHPLPFLSPISLYDSLHPLDLETVYGGPVLLIGVLEARDLGPGAASPYCVITPVDCRGKEVMKERATTRRQPASEAPRWDEVFCFSKVSPLWLSCCVCSGPLCSVTLRECVCLTDCVYPHDSVHGKCIGSRCMHVRVCAGDGRRLAAGGPEGQPPLLILLPPLRDCRPPHRPFPRLHGKGVCVIVGPGVGGGLRGQHGCVCVHVRVVQTDAWVELPYRFGAPTWVRIL